MSEVSVTTETTDFAVIAAEFLDRVSRHPWCNVATVDARRRPRSRLLHPIWEGPIGSIGTWRTSVRSQHQTPSLKVSQIERNPFVSLAYVADVMRPVYIDCHAVWIEDLEEKRRVWDLFRATPPPLGYDPAEVFHRYDDPRFGLIRLTAYRIALVEFPAPPGKVIIWRGQAPG